MKDSLSFFRVSQSNIGRLAEEMSQLHFKVRGQKRSPFFWRWRYFNNPAGKSSLILAAKKGKIVGIYGLSYLLLRIGQKIETAGLIENNSIDPCEKSWQCYRGLVKKSIDESQKDKLGFRFGICTPKTAKLSQRFGMVSLGYTPFYLGLLDVSEVLKKWNMPHFLSKISRLAYPFFGLKNKKNKLLFCNIRPVRNFSSDFSRLYASVAGNYDIGIIKNSAYLNWRYQEYPEIRYRCLAAYEGKRPKGFIVFYLENSGRKAAIVELLARGNNQAVIKKLLLKAVCELREKKAGYIIASFSPESAQAVVLKKSGFRPWGTKLWPRQIMVGADSLAKVHPQINLDRWNFSLGDWGGY